MKLNWFDAKETKPTDEYRGVMAFVKCDDDNVILLTTTVAGRGERWKDVLYWAFAPTLEDVEDEVW